MLDFPAGPHIGDNFGSWTWDGTKWTPAAGGVAGVASFNTRTGAVALSNADVTAVLPASSTLPAMDGVATFGTGTSWARSDHVHPSDTSRAPLSSPTFTGVVTIPSGAAIAGYAPLVSPAFTGTPSAPTATPGTNTTQLATTAFVASSIVAAAGVASFNTRTGAVTLQAADLTGAGGALLASPVFTGVPAAPTATAGTSTTQLATTAFVQAALPAVPAASSTTPAMDGAAAIGVGTTYARADHVHPSDTSRAPLASPVFTGVPSLPTGAIGITQTVGTSNTSLATTAFVQAAIPAVPPPSSTTPSMDGTAAIGTGTTYARADHVHPTDTSRYAASNPSGFITGNQSIALSGDVTGSGTTSIAATVAALQGRAIVATAPTSNQVLQWSGTAWTPTTPAAVPPPAASSPLMDGSVAVGTATTYARADHVHPTDTTRAAISSPTFTGVPAAPTATVGTNTTQLATTAFVQAALPAVPAASSTTPLMDGTAAIGTGTTWARADHVHPTDTSLLPLAGGTVTGNLTVNNNIFAGVSASVGFPTPAAAGQGALNAYALGLDGASYITFNGYLGSGPFNYYQTGGAAQIVQNGGQLQFSGTATSGAAGAAITTFAITMTLNPNGNLVLVGPLTATGGSLSGNLTVSAGGINVTGASTFANNVTVSTGGLTVSGGGIAITGSGTFSGNLTVSGSGTSTFGSNTGPTNVFLNGAQANNRQIFIQSAGVSQWSFGGPGTVDYALQRYVSGTFTDSPIQVRNATGSVELCNSASIADTIIGHQVAKGATDVTGFLVIPFLAGAPTGTPTNASKGAPIVYDTTNHKLWVYDAGWKGVVVA